MPNLFAGTISGQGSIAFGGQFTVTDMDSGVHAIGPNVIIDGGNTRTRYKFLGWWALWNSAYGGSNGHAGEVIDSGFFGWDTEDIIFSFPSGYQADHLDYKLGPGVHLDIRISY